MGTPRKHCVLLAFLWWFTPFAFATEGAQCPSLQQVLNLFHPDYAKQITLTERTALDKAYDERKVEEAVRKVLWNRKIQSNNLYDATKSKTISVRRKDEIQKSIRTGVADPDEVLKAMGYTPQHPHYLAIHERIPAIAEKFERETLILQSRTLRKVNYHDYHGNPIQEIYEPWQKDKKWHAAHDANERHLNDRKGNSYFVYESHRVRRGKNAEMNRLIEEVESMGGEVRILSKIDRGPAKPLNEAGFSYFRSGYDGKPILAFEVEASAHVVAHEVEHFHYWRKIFKEESAKTNNPVLANFNAQNKLAQIEHYYGTEKAAVLAEQKINGQNVFTPGYAERAAYPSQVALDEEAKALIELRINIPRSQGLKPEFTLDNVFDPIWIRDHQKYIDYTIGNTIWTRMLQKNHLTQALKEGSITKKEAALVKRSLDAGIGNPNEILRLIDVRPSNPLYKIYRDRIPELYKELQLKVEQFEKSQP